MALIGYPAVVLDDNPDVNVDLIEGMPQMEVLRKDDTFVMQITPAPHAELAPSDDYEYLYDTDEPSARKPRRCVTSRYCRIRRNGCG